MVVVSKRERVRPEAKLTLSIDNQARVRYKRPLTSTYVDLQTFLSGNMMMKKRFLKFFDNCSCRQTLSACTSCWKAVQFGESQHIQNFVFFQSIYDVFQMTASLSLSLSLSDTCHCHSLQSTLQDICQASKDLIVFFILTFNFDYSIKISVKPDSVAFQKKKKVCMSLLDYVIPLYMFIFRIHCIFTCRGLRLIL